MSRLCQFAAALLACGVMHAGVACQASFAELAGRTVDEVRIETPLSFPSSAANQLFFGSLSASLARLKPGLAIQAGQKFDLANYNAGRLQILGVITAQMQQNIQRVYLAVTLPALENCDAGGVTVVYRIYSTDVISSAMGFVESDPTRITRNLVSAATGSQASHIISPLAGYNASRGAFGGTAVKFKVNGGIFQNFHASVAGSQGNVTTGLGFSGERDFGTRFLDHGEWRLDYRYSNDPIAGSDTKLRSGTMNFQFLGTTHTSTRGSVIGRYGVAVEGGNRQSNLSGDDALGAIASASYGALKGYGGVSFGIGRGLGAASYGLQLGKSPGSIDVGYVKHLVDVKFKQRFLPKAHLPIQVDSAFNAGWIQSSSNEIPVLERFFGGNVTREFVAGDSWKIQDGPQLRSFPQGAFNSVPGGPFGATRFISGNFTIAPAVKHYPAVPDDVLRDPLLRTQLGFQLKSVKEAFVSDCEVRTNFFPAAVASLRPLDAAVENIESWNARLHTLSLSGDVMDLLSDVDDNLSNLKEDLARIASNPKSPAAVGAVRRITTSTASSLVLQLAESADALADGVAGSPASGEEANIRDSARKIRDAVKPGREAFAKVDALNMADPAKYEQLVERLPRLRAALEGMQAPLDALNGHEGDEIADARDAALQYLDDSLRKLRAAADPANRAEVYNKLDDVLTDWGATSPASPKSLLEAVAFLQGVMRAAKPPLPAQSLDAPVSAVKAELTPILNAWDSLARPPMQSCARSEAAFAVRAADAVFRELNLFQVSPVAIFDFARLSMPGIGSTGVRYGAGPGLRFSIATLNVTLGYAFNIAARSGEGNGAFFFSLDVSDLFR